MCILISFLDKDSNQVYNHSNFISHLKGFEKKKYIAKYPKESTRLVRGAGNGLWNTSLSRAPKGLHPVGCDVAAHVTVLWHKPKRPCLKEVGVMMHQ